MNFYSIHSNKAFLPTLICCLACTNTISALVFIRSLIIARTVKFQVQRSFNAHVSCKNEHYRNVIKILAIQLAGSRSCFAPCLRLDLVCAKNYIQEFFFFCWFCDQFFVPSLGHLIRIWCKLVQIKGSKLIQQAASFLAYIQ